MPVAGATTGGRRHDRRQPTACDRRRQTEAVEGWHHDRPRRSARRRPLVGRPPLRPARVGRAGRPAAEGSPESAASDAEILRLSPLHQYFLAVPPRLLRVMDTFLVLRSESILLPGGTRLTRSGCKTISNIAARTVLSASVCTTLLMCLKFCNSELAL